MPYKDPEKRRAYHQQYYAAHRDDIIARSRQWEQDNPERKRASNQRAYHKDLDKSRARRRKDQKAYAKRHPDKVNESQKRWRKANPEKVQAIKRADYARRRSQVITYVRQWQQENPAKHMEYVRQWQKDNPDKMRSIVATRRARREKAFVEHVEYAVLYERDRGMCQLRIHPDCPGHITPKQGSIDHIIPVALGGGHSYRNTQLACLRCNRKKNKHGKGDQLRLF